MYPLGSIVAAPKALHALAEAGRTPAEFIAQHAAGDWGDIGPDDAQENAFSLTHGFRLFSSYIYDPAEPESKDWVITEADRSSTCVLLPADY
jgi:hypothetical protein